MTPTRSYLVCATPRSGSTLLCRLLDQTGVAGRPEEYFEALRHSGMPRRPRSTSTASATRTSSSGSPSARCRASSRAGTQPAVEPGHLRRVSRVGAEQGTTPNGVFGAKLMWGYLGDFAQLLRGIDGLGGLPVPELLGRVFPDLRYVQITREDKVRQAVSLWKAVQTQAWRREDGDADGLRRPSRRFSFRAINYLVRQLTAHDASWDAYFLGLGHEPLKITYEELAAAPSRRRRGRARAPRDRCSRTASARRPAARGAGRRALRGLGAPRPRASRGARDARGLSGRPRRPRARFADPAHRGTVVRWAARTTSSTSTGRRGSRASRCSSSRPRRWPPTATSTSRRRARQGRCASSVRARSATSTSVAAAPRRSPTCARTAASS